MNQTRTHTPDVFVCLVNLLLAAVIMQSRFHLAPPSASLPPSVPLRPARLIHHGSATRRGGAHSYSSRTRHHKSLERAKESGGGGRKKKSISSK